MRRPWFAILPVTLAAASLVSTSARALPQTGVLAPGRSLGGVPLGATERAVKKTWGRRFGVCRHCPDRTLYFTYAPFTPEGVVAVFRNGRTVSLFTLSSPTGWRTTRWVRIGDPVSRVRAVYGQLTRAECEGYYALTLVAGRTITAFYVVNGKLWGFGLSRVGAPLCH